MRIKKLSIHGFKSFVDKITFNFPSGASAIIGPNGCGKSNIVDAIRWALGEQNARHLRGKLMEDVIFAGSETRKPLGMAEVILTFSNEQGLGPAEFANFTEIEVSRRLYRSGESEYSINRVPSRLRDIIDLFADTGVGTRAYSIIEQGQVGWLINAKPDERRIIFEEAAGVSRFKHKKEAAMRRLEAAKENLTRVNDIISEVKRQLNSLNRQAKKAERYKALREELKSVELALSSAELKRLAGFLDGASRRLEEAKDEEIMLSSSIAEKEALLEGIKADHAREETEYRAAREKAFEIESLIRKEEQSSALAAMRVEELRRHEERLLREIDELRASGAAATEEAARLGDEISGVGSLIEAETLKLEDGSRRLEALDSLLREKEALKRENAAESMDLAARLAELRHSLQALMKDEEHLRHRESKAASEKEDAAKKLLSMEAPIASLKDDLRRSASEKESIEAGLTGIKDRLDALEKEKTVGEAGLKGLEDEFSRASARLSALEEMEKNFDNLRDGARAIMRRNDAGVFGLMADVIETNPGYEKAVEAVMGERLQYLIVGTQKDGVEAIEYLKKNGAGRGSFVPAREARPLRAPLPVEAGVDYPATKGLLGEIRIKDGYDPVVSYVIGDAVVVEDLPAALDLWRQNGAYRTIVTLDGEVIDPQGTITGGSSNSGDPGILQKRGEIKMLRQRASELEGRISALDGEVKAAEEAILATRPSLEAYRERLHEADIARVNLENALKARQDEFGRLTALVSSMTAEIDESGARLAEIAVKKAALSGEREGLETAAAQKDALAAVYQDALSKVAAEKEGLSRAVTEIRVALAKAKERFDALGRQAAEREKAAGESSARIRSREDEIAAGGEEAALKAGEIDSLKARLEGLLGLADAAKNEGSGKAELLQELSGRMTETDAGLKGIKARSNRLTELKGEISIEIKETELAMANLKERMNEKYGVDIGTPATDGEEAPALDTLESSKDDLREKIAALGEVSLSALEEYADLERRHQFLVDQQSDLSRSVESLHAAITKINRTTREKFKSAFDEINSKFQETFPRFFNGGKAELRLADDGDILEAGIEIVAQPPGKRLQNITLLSGGEKALTATSLIFSIFLIKPSPFCLLDEVDAPLDEANIDRFNGFVREMAERSQFVLITHNKKTMEMADALYGITMEEPGVSKTISLRF